MLNQPGVYFNDVGYRNRQPDHLSETRAQPVIYQHSGVLRIVLKLNHVVMAIGATHEMTLRAAAHTANMLNRLYWHGCLRSFLRFLYAEGFIERDLAIAVRPRCSSRFVFLSLHKPHRPRSTVPSIW